VVSIFKEKSAPAVVGLIFLCVALHAFFLFTPPSIVTSPGEGLLHTILQPLAGVPTIFLSLLYYIIVLAQALRFNNLFNDVRMYPKQAFVAGLSYVLLTALLPAWNNISSALVANSLIIWLFFRIVKLYSTPQAKALVYNIGLIAGCTILLYYPALSLIPLVFFALGVARPFRFNEWIILLLGIITPAYFWCGYLFLTGQLMDTIHNFTSIFKLHKVLDPNIKYISIALGVAGLVMVTGIFGWQANSSRMVIQVRKLWGTLFVMLLLMVPVLFVIINTWPGALLLACVPAAAFTGNAFLYPKKIISAILFWLMVAVVVYINWVPFKI